MRSPYVFVILAGGVVAGAIGLAIGGIAIGIAAALAGAATTAALRALMGDAPAALVASLAGALVMATSIVDGDVLAVRTAIGVAAMAWTIAELARAALPGSSPIVAMLPAIVATVLDASFAPLIPIAGLRLVTAPWRRPRWIVAVPIVGALGVGLAILAVLARDGVLGELGDIWTGRVAHAIAPIDQALQLGDALGPFVAFAAIAGCASIAGRGRHVQAALVAVIAASLFVDHRAGSVGTSTIAIAAIIAGLAIGRLAAMIRIPVGQAIVGTLIGAMLVLPPAWTTIERQTTTSR